MARDREPCYSSCCIECGRGSNQALYKEFSGGTIQLSQCVSFAVVLNLALYLPLPSSSSSPPPHPPTHSQVHCHKVLDKYVEFDAVILLLDVLLLRIQSFRHLIFNYGISFSVSPRLLALSTCPVHFPSTELSCKSKSNISFYQAH